MRRKRLWETSWYPIAVAICLGVIVYIVLSKFSSVWSGIQTFIGYFHPVILGGVIAYIVNPLAKCFNSLLKEVKNQKVRQLLSNSLAFLVLILFLIFTILILIPQLIESVETFIVNLNGYIDTVNNMLETIGVTNKEIDLSNLITSSENILSSISAWTVENIDSILAASANFGKNFFTWVIAFILSAYLLSEKDRLKAGTQRLLRAIFGEDNYQEISIFLRKSNMIGNRYIVYNLIDSLIIGVANAVFMTLFGMQYVGLISFIMAVTNLVPTFGPMVGLIFSGFILLMVHPWHAFFFFVFTLVLQTCDAYVIKPKLFGNSLGVSGLWILIAVIVGGNMLGIIGILLAIPCVAIMDFVYSTYIIVYLEKRHDKIDEKDHLLSS